MRAGFVALVFLALAISSFVGAASAQDGIDPRELAEQVHTEGEYADELLIRGSEGVSSFPDRASGGGGESLDARRFDGWGRGDASDRTSAPGGRGQAPPPNLPLGGMLGGEIMSTVLLVGVGLLLIVLIVVVFFALRGERKPPPPVRRPQVTEGVPRSDELPWDVGDPDELAARGRYSEAILAVLVGSLKSVGWQPRGERARTAREVLWSIPASDARRKPLDEVVTRAERVRFAGDEATLETFREVKHWSESVRSSS